MDKPRLSPAMRTLLHNAPHGRPLITSLTRNSISNKASSTLHALHRAGMLANLYNEPTEAGRAYFSAKSETP